MGENTGQLFEKTVKIEPTAFVVCVTAVATQICFAGLITETFKSDDSLVEASIDIMESCYADRLSNVGLAGPSAGSILARMLSRKIVIPAILIGESSRSSTHDPSDHASRYKLQAFVITASDPITLGKTLARLKNSKWWNHLAVFLLIGRPGMENGCSNAYEILWEAWTMNLLKTNLMCLHRTRGRLIYTFNPYTNEAPFPWQRENTYEGINGHVWTLFVRKYREGESPCATLDFDKTSNLGGYEIHASGGSLETWWFVDPAAITGISERVANVNARILIDSINATWTVTSRHPNSTVGTELLVGKSDIVLNTMPAFHLGEYEMTNLNLQTTLAVVTRYSGYKSQLDKFVSVLDRWSRFCVIVVLTISLLFFKFYLRNRTIPALLNLVLIVCNAALPKIPDKLAARIYLGCLFIFLVTVHGIYQGQVASLLTKQVRLPSVDSIDDLSRSDHTIYGFRLYQPFFNQSGLYGRWTDSRERNCTEYVLRDPKAACANDRFVLISEAARFKLHLSRETFGTVYLTYLIRKDWPLAERIDKIHGRVTSSGIAKNLYERDLNNVLDILEAYENHDQDDTCRVLTFEDLSFAFVILAIGLMCSAITFVIEVTVFGRGSGKSRSGVRRRVEFVR